MAELPVILALDASTDACTVALELPGHARFVRSTVIPRGHARELLGMIESLLVEADVARSAIGLVAYGRGPGAFTGVRIGVGLAQGLGWGLGVPLAGVSTLAAIAQRAGRELGGDRVLVAMDARMREVYWAACERDLDSGLMRPRTEERLSAPELVRAPADWPECHAAGTGWQAHGETLASACDCVLAGRAPDMLPDARDLLDYGQHAWRTGAVQRADEAAPVYLRDRVTG